MSDQIAVTEIRFVLSQFFIFLSYELGTDASSLMILPYRDMTSMMLCTFLQLIAFVLNFIILRVFWLLWKLIVLDFCRVTKDIFKEHLGKFLEKNARFCSSSECISDFPLSTNDASNKKNGFEKYNCK